jgi:hypothetical protein
MEESSRLYTKEIRGDRTDWSPISSSVDQDDHDLIISLGASSL